MMIKLTRKEGEDADDRGERMRIGMILKIDDKNFSQKATFSLKSFRPFSDRYQSARNILLELKESNSLARFASAISMNKIKAIGNKKKSRTFDTPIHPHVR